MKVAPELKPNVKNGERGPPPGALLTAWGFQDRMGPGDKRSWLRDWPPGATKIPMVALRLAFSESRPTVQRKSDCCP